MEVDDTWAVVDEALSALPGCGDDLFDRLWVKRGMSFESSSRQTDPFDEYSARLICAAFSGGAPKDLFVVLPDNLSHRPALLFATALVRRWYDSRPPPGQASATVHPPVLYFGSAVGIREQLAHVRIRNSAVNLAEVFRQGNVGSRGTAVGLRRGRLRADGTLDLPRVFTIYSPADPVRMLERHRPKWIAVDCGDAPNAHWLDPLLQHASKRGIQVIGWGHNPLSDCVKLFRQHGEVFAWPARVPTDYPRAGNCTSSLHDIFRRGVTETKVQPFVLASPSVERLDGPLGHARRLLLTATMRNVLGRLGADALRAHWRCLNALSTLSVPLDFYESESQHVWGLEPVGKLLRSCEVFRAACRHDHGDLARDLSRVGEHLATARILLEEKDTPLWEALCQLCIEEPMSDEARLVTFLSRAQKQLFLLALLARYNVVREDLEEVSTWVASVDDVRRWTRQLVDGAESSEGGALDAPDKSYLSWRPMLVGLPGAHLTPRLSPVLTQRNADVLLYPHQSGALARRMSEWSRLLNPDASGSLGTLRRLGCSSCTAEADLPTGTRVRLEDSATFNVRRGRVIGRAPVGKLWEPEDESESIARLLRTVEEAGEEEAPPLEVLNANAGTLDANENGAQETWCETAQEVRFAGGWSVLFDPDEQVNVLVAAYSGTKLDRRYVRSLRKDDRVLLIHGQRRQNLYDLIVSRVHRNPAIELHVALVRRWQDDFVVAYRRWKRHGERNLDELLAQMRRRGSELTSSLTLRQWLLRHTLCPHDHEDLLRLACVLEMGFVKEHYKHIHNAASRLRGLHRGLSNRLNRWLEQETAGTATQSDEDVVDADLGLRFGDFRSSLQVLTVEGTMTVAGPFLRTTLGHVGRNG